MSVYATVARTGSGYRVFYSPRNGAMPGAAPKLFGSLEDLIAYLLSHTDFSRSYEAVLRERLEKEGSHTMELELIPEAPAQTTKD
jgi:hypothetical protein